LSEHYYEKKMKEFFELKLGTMAMEEYKKRFFELFKYVDFIKDEKVKIQRFLSGFPSFIVTIYNMITPKPWRKQYEEKDTFMRKAEEGQFSKNLGTTR
jgi:hypothetical protein